MSLPIASAYSQQIGFASGILIGTRIDVANATPQKFGILQDVHVDFTADLKQLHGQGRYPPAAMRRTWPITCDLNSTPATAMGSPAARSACAVQALHVIPAS